MKKLALLFALLLTVAVRADVEVSAVVPTAGGGGGGVTVGTTPVAGCQNLVLYGDNSSVLNCEANLAYTASSNTLLLTAGQLLVPEGTAAAPGVSRQGDTNDGLFFGEVHYFVRDGVESVGASGSGTSSSLTFCTSGAAGCGNSSILRASGLFTGLSSSALALTAATMTQEQGSGNALLTTSTSSYTWSNAQVAALGATTTGDITVATLPAKTQVLDAMVVITGTAAGPTTVTVSCGDAIAGTPFINYVVASDAKVAANTVYGDAVAERGTSIDTEFWYLPSYTATTLVTCHFISSGGNLSTVTGSTGRVILTTRLLP
jgi:hypothetical protein